MGKSDQGVRASKERYTVIPRVLVFFLDGGDVLLLKGAPTKRIWANRYNGVGGHVEAGEELGDAIVDRYALYVYKVLGDRMQRVFAAETGRALGENRVLGGIAFKPSAQGTSIELRPGRAVGWSARTYPFNAETEPNGGLQPLVLPWSESTYTYRFDGSEFAQR